MRLPSALAVLIGLLAMPAAAQDGARGPGEARPPGAYAGVVPGTGNSPPRAPEPGAGRALLMTWPGFQQRPDGASRFFLQTTGPVQIEQRTEGNRFVLVLKGCGLHLRNNRRPLETRYFNTPVSRARIERRGGDLAFVLELRAQVTPLVSTQQGQGGFNFVFVELPGGSYLPEDLRTERQQDPTVVPDRRPAGGGDTTEIIVY